MLKKHYILLLLIVIIAPNTNAQTFNYYFGNIHAHSSYSDGNKDSSTSLMTTPLQDFNYAKAAQQIDFYGISEHNHYSAGMTNPINYHRGLADADAANSDGSFVALYGMEWGVISTGGHVIIYGYDSLIGWDSNNHDVYVAQTDYVGLWKKINEKAGAFAYLAHPQTSDFGNILSNAVNLNADNAIIGMAARSGPAFSTNTTYSNPSTSNYISRYNDALKRGYHVGVGLDHDTHNTVFGQQTAGRMVVLAPSLTRADILLGIRKMRFYSSDDWNVKVNFNISNQPMGSILTQTSSPTIKVSVTDPDASETVSSIAIYYGVPGSGSNPTVLATLTNTSAVSYVHTITNNSTYYYYLRVTQNDGNIVWTSPIWYTRNDALTNTPPVANFSASTTTICAGQSITLNDNTTNGPSDWNWSLPGAWPNASINQTVTATYYNAGTYTVSLSASNIYGTSATKNTTITVIPLPNLSVAQTTICNGQTDTLTATGATTYSWSTGATTPTISISPTSSTQYTVTGTSNGCSKSIKTIVAVIGGCVGIEELTKGTIKLYPNPANHFITLDLNGVVNDKTIEVYDALGKRVLLQSGTESIIQLDMSSFNSGIYLVKIILDNKFYTIEKFIIERE